ncbi:MAG: 50S ribosomal protein L25 [Candidatus Doudnabacteria bacterium CG10_big_fil_rev_8_21_14_0_10_41_10]|uniref:Large ribosomal subunit protein bL25 n=1 Tax=Candidatus Doudnabacteria bacterium CG10_big_fil_rev_8_21_14_0_10_41_10 TaxID=1974551 RepID=A0A2H0VF10_9BACT|nr:MAG: 50S ribosomal protein L25 [Candidatus Doudnabacteria bacterium CG10_big_fil_rev_8_21_14_0_10_41_10]
MGNRLKVSAQNRAEVRKQAQKLRREGLLPGVVYGKQLESKNLSVNRKEFEKIYKQTGESTLVDLTVGSEKPLTVLVNAIQRDGLTNEILHVDFHEVDMKTKIKAKVILQFVGEAMAVKDLGGVLVKNVTEVEVECLPADLPKGLVINISKLKTFQDSIKISDLEFDHEKVKVALKPETVVVKVAEPRTEEELKELSEKPIEDAVESVEGVVKEEKKEGEEGKDGEKKEETSPKEEKKS